MRPENREPAFMAGYASYLIPSAAMMIIGSIFIGIANGVGVPYLNTIASIKGGKNSATTVIPCSRQPSIWVSSSRPSYSFPCRTACLEPTLPFHARLPSCSASSSSFRFSLRAISNVCHQRRRGN